MISSSHFPLIYVSEKDVLEILNLFSTQSFVIEKFYSEISNYLFPDQIPKITKRHLSQVEERLHKQNSLAESLLPIKDLFRYDSNKIVKYIHSFSNPPEYAPILIMYFVISFISISDLSTVSSSFSDMLEAIIISKGILPRNYFIFSLSSCVIRYIESTNNSSIFTIVKKAISSVQSDIFQLFTFLMVKSLKINDQESFEYLIITLYDSVMQNPKEFENCNFLNALSFLSQKILSFDPLTLKLIDSLTYIRPNDTNLNDCLESIPLYFQQHTESIFKISTIDAQHYDTNQSFRFSYDFEKKSYFTNGLVPLSSDFFDKNFKIDADVDKIMTIMADFVQNLEPSYFHYFFNSIPIKNDLIYLIYIKLLSIFSKKIKITEKIYEKIMNPSVFIPTITLFDYKEEYNNIFYLRKEIFEIIMKNESQLIISILVHFNSAPLLFSEFIGRLHCNLSSFNNLLLANDELINSIVQIIMYLKKENSEKYQKARSTLDLFLFSIFKDEPQVRNKFFESSIFVSGYFTSLFEPTLHSSIINSFLSFLQNFNSSPELLKPSIEMISTVINFCDDVETALSILHSITEILSINSRIKKNIAPFIDSITAFLHLHPSRNLLNETIQLYLHCEHQFQMRQIRNLSDSIHKINGDKDPDDQLVLNFLCLISNSHSASLHNRFTIFNEALLITFFSIFQTPQKAKPIFELFLELCKYSPFNCYKFNKAEIDLLFIEMIKNYPSKFNFRGCRMNSCIIESKRQILDILCLILTVRSTIPVCLNMISLLKYSSQEFDVINILLSHLAPIRKNIQPIGFCNPIIESYENGIRGKDIDNGFSFQFWVKVDEAICHYSSSIIDVLSIIDDHIKMTFKINNNGSLMAEVKGSETVHTAIFKNRFPSGVWSFVTLAFKRPEKNMGYLYFSINGEKYDRYTMKNLAHFSHNYATVKVGKIESLKPIKSVYPLFFGDYFFYSRKLKNIENFEHFQKGENKADFVFRNKSPKKCLFPNFLDIFLTNDVHHFILPYFYLEEEKLPNMFLEALLNILTVSVSYHEKVDIDFKVYSYALKKSNKITFTLYQRFFSILDNSITNKTMKSLVYDILLNFGIWTRTKEPGHLNRIAQNWGNSLFDSCSSVLTDFSFIFSQIPIYFSFNDPKNKSIDVAFCRSCIDKLLLSIALTNFTNENTISILSYCALSDDQTQILCNFDLLYRISLIRSDFSLFLCELLFYFLKPKKEKQFVAVLKIISSVSKLKFPKFVDSILCIFNEFFVTKELLDLLLEMMPNFPMIYPLVIFIAINMKDKIDLTKITQSLQTLKIPFLAANWLLMPLILFTITKSVDIVLFCSSNMVDHFSIDAFEHSLTYIDFLSSILNFNFDEFTLKFAKINVDFMNNEKMLDSQVMFTLCSRLLLINNQETFSFRNFIDEQIKTEKDENFLIFDAKNFCIDSNPLFELNSSFDNYLIQIHKDISNQQYYFRVSVCPLMMSVIRIFQSAQIDIPLLQKFCQFFISVTKEKKSRLKPFFLESLNTLFPYYYENVINTMRESSLSMQKKQIEYWTNSKADSIKFLTSFGREEAAISIPSVDFINDDEKTNKVIENHLRKNVFSQFSIWSNKKLYLTEIRRVFQYSNIFHQIRLKKSENLGYCSFENTIQTTPSSLKNINPNSNSASLISSTSNSNTNSNLSSNQDSDYSSTISDQSGSNQNNNLTNNVAYKNDLNSKEFSENAFFKAKCLLIKISSETPADFTLKFDQFVLQTNRSQKIVKLYEIEHIFKRNRFQIENSIEFILVNGRSLLLDFSPLNSNVILSQFRNLRCDNLKTFMFSTPRKSFEKSGLIEKWKNREISNFEYLMALNIYSGRTFNDSNLYPIFPWILTNYSEFESNFPSSRSTDKFSKLISESGETTDENKKKKIEISQFPNSSPNFTPSQVSKKQESVVDDTLLSDDENENEIEIDVKPNMYSNRVMNRSTSYISNESNYRSEKRNLSKPIAIQTEEKFHEFNMKFSIEHPISHLNCFFLVAPSSTAIIAHWLIRQPPFTQLHLKTENGKFGYPTRLFQSMSRAAYQAINGTISWELCPEFFSFPEIFTNLNKYKLGNKVKNDVFSLNDAIEFVYIHRKALESEEVSSYLNNWIDLIFGCKTRNIESGNIYSPILCDDVWKTCSNKYSKSFIVDTLKIAGQLPQSMFIESHPKRKLLISPYSKSNLNENNNNNNNNDGFDADKIIFPSNVASVMVKRLKQRQKLQSKIYILTDKVDVNDLLSKEKSNIIAQMNSINEQINFSLFDFNEFQENSNDFIKIKHSTFLKKIISSPSSSSESTEKIEEYVFLVEISDFVIGTMHINFDKKTCYLKLSKDKNYKNIRRDTNNWKQTNEKDILYSNFSHGFITANRICNEIFIVRKSTISRFSIHYNEQENENNNTENEQKINENDYNNLYGSEFDFLSCDGNEFCIGNIDGRFDIYYINQIKAKPSFSFNFMYEKVSCFCFSHSFGVLVIGTVNGFIYIVDSKSGLVSFRSNVIDQNMNLNSNSESDSFLVSSSSSSFSVLDSKSSSSSYLRDGKIPKKILVTEGFGFIVVYCDDLSMFVFNINGTLIRKRKLNFSATILFSFKSNSGFDFIVAADSKGGIRFCEAFYLDFDENPIYICRSEILSISYDVSYDAILVTTKNGVFFRIPTNTNHWIF